MLNLLNFVDLNFEAFLKLGTVVVGFLLLALVIFVVISGFIVFGADAFNSIIASYAKHLEIKERKSSRR